MTSDLRATGVRRGNRGDNSTVVCSQGKVIQWWTHVSSVSSNANGQELLKIGNIPMGKGWSATMTKQNTQSGTQLNSTGTPLESGDTLADWSVL